MLGGLRRSLASLAEGCCKTPILRWGLLRRENFVEETCAARPWRYRRGRQPYCPPNVSRTHRVVLGDPTTADPHRPTPSRRRDGEWTIHVHRREFE